MSLPVRIKFDELPKHALPRSSTARFSEKWQKSLGDEGFLEQVVERWRASGIGSAGDMSSQLAMMAEAMGITSNAEPEYRMNPRRGAAIAHALWRRALGTPRCAPDLAVRPRIRAKSGSSQLNQSARRLFLARVVRP